MRERDPKERNEENQWKSVKRTKTRSQQPQALRTCFINHLQPSITILEISQTFRTHGAIVNISIPASQKNPKHIFAFVQYHYPQSLLTAIRDENGETLKGSRITIFPAKYDKCTTYLPQNLKSQTKRTQPPGKVITSKPNNNKTSFRDFRSYRDVTKLSHDHPKPNTNNPQKTQEANRTP